LSPTILAMAGHIAAGTNENVIPSRNMGIKGFMVVSAKIRCTTTSIADPTNIREAPHPLKSMTHPKSGVKKMVPKYMMLEISLALVNDIPHLLTKRSGA